MIPTITFLQHVRIRMLAKDYGSYVVLFGLLSLAAVLRFSGFDWDQGIGFHPDERSIYMRSYCMFLDMVGKSPPGYCGIANLDIVLNLRQYFDPQVSPLNPHWFPLGTILIYLLVFSQFILPVADVMDLRYVGRTLTIVAELFTIIVYYRLAYRMFGVKAALFAATLIAFSVSHIQYSLFYRPEPFMVLFSGLVLLNCWNRYTQQSWKTSVWIGVTLGIAVSFKVTSILLITPIIVMFLGLWWRDINFRFNNKLTALLGEGVVIGLLAGLTFVILSPFSILDFQQFYSDVKIQSMMAGSAGMFPFTTQYFGTPFLLYNARQIFFWGLGIPIGLLTVVLIVKGIWNLYATKTIRFQYIFLLSWVLPFFFFMESYEVRFLRYLYPIIPVLFVLNADFITQIPGDFRRYFSNLLSKSNNFVVGFGFLIVSIIMASHLIYGIGFVQIYKSDHTAIRASEWIQESIPTNSKIITESHWDEQIPGLHNYKTWLYPAYEEDTIDKIYELATYLESSEYIVFYSNRPYVGITADQSRYPYSSAYYDELFNNGLGYELSKVFYEYPSFLGFHIKNNDWSKTGLVAPDVLKQIDQENFGISVGYADENVINYDHPLVLVFEKTMYRSTESILNAILENESQSLYPYQAPNLETQNIYVKANNYEEPLRSDFNAIIIWLMALLLLSTLSIPTALLICKFLPMQGYALSKILGLFIVAYVFWALVSTGFITNTLIYCWLVIVLFGLFNTLLFYKFYSDIRLYFVNNWKYVCTVEVVFIASFVLFLILRMSNPDLWHPYRGGEKPMELAYLNAVLSSMSFPPYDPWMSGSVMNYYYWGYVPLAILTKVTSLPTIITFNLSVVTLFAITSTLLFSFGSNLFLGLNGTFTDCLKNKFIKVCGCGALGILFVLILGNTDGAIQIWEKIASASPISSWFYGFDYWRSSRIIPVLEQIPISPGMFWIGNEAMNTQNWSPHITEFPFFTFLFADLHAHMISIPFSIMVLMLGINVYCSKYYEKGVIASLFLFSIACGSLFAINSWDYPTYCGLGLLLLLGRLMIQGVTRYGFRETLFMGVFYIAIGYFSFWAFHLGFNSAGASLVPSLWSTPVLHYIQIKLLPLCLTTTLIGICIVKDLYLRRGIVGFKINYPILIMILSSVLVGLYVGFLGWWLSTLLIMLLLGLIYCAKSLTTDTRLDLNRKWLLLPIIFMSYSLLVDLGVEFVRYDDDIGRMNTLFKFYLQSWVISGIAATGIIILIGYMLSRLTNVIHRGFPISFFAVLLLVLMIYPVFSIYPRVSDRFSQTIFTIDGLEYAKHSIHVERDEMLVLDSDRKMIEWLNRSVSGTPVILEATGDQYRWNGRVSSYTGFPTVLGWPWHQMQQKPYLHLNIMNRFTDIKNIYSSSNLDVKRRLIDKYQIDLIVWGDIEAIYYGRESLNSLDKMYGMGMLDKIYSADRNIVYKTTDY